MFVPNVQGQVARLRSTNAQVTPARTLAPVSTWSISSSVSATRPTPVRRVRRWSVMSTIRASTVERASLPARARVRLVSLAQTAASTAVICSAAGMEQTALPGSASVHRGTLDRPVT